MKKSILIVVGVGIPVAVLLLVFIFLRQTYIDAEQHHPQVFPPFEGWILGEIKTYEGDDLYEPIDGEADRFLHFRFEQAFFGSYKQQNGEGIVEVQTFKMGFNANAFGIFTFYDSKNLKHDILDPHEALSAASDSELIFYRYDTFARISLHNMEPNPELLKKMGDAIARKTERWGRNIKGKTIRFGS